ncbi:hypothetical protein GBA52_015160 [Prunus armeniaca]|nr:hypothetical protein GBA52_015160 [Prunus armeniaca]
MNATAATSYATTLVDVAKSNNAFETTTIGMEKIKKFFVKPSIFDFFIKPSFVFLSFQTPLYFSLGFSASISLLLLLVSFSISLSLSLSSLSLSQFKNRVPKALFTALI